MSAEGLQFAAAILDAIGLPAAVLDSMGRVLAANARFDRLIPCMAREKRARIEIGDALARVGAIADSEMARLIPVAATEGRPPMIFHLVPVRDALTGAHAVLVVTSLASKPPPGAELLQGLFDLTPAEARVARAIAQQRTIDAITKDFGLSRETVRTQVKSVLAKTGFGRQSGLAVALASAILCGPAD